MAEIYSLKTENFEGPLEKLLELIESKRLEISDVSLSRVTDEFLKYLSALRADSPEDGARLRLLADFLVVASKLLLIKSKQLLPDMALTPEEETEVRDLGRRLSFYRDLKPALGHVRRFWREGGGMWSRPYFLDIASYGGGGIFYPGRNLTAPSLAESLGGIFGALSELAGEVQTVKERIVSIEERMRDILSRLGRGGAQPFRSLMPARTPAEVIISFLAILHLAREQAIRIEQEAQFSDILVSRNVDSSGVEEK